jgi:pimeloyl-ACP methyl ester carboxylesterase
MNNRERPMQTRRVIRNTLAIAALAATATAAHAEDPRGDWIGQMDSGFKVRIQVSGDGAGYAATLTNPGGVVTRLDQFTSDGQTLQFAIPKLGLAYAGQWSDSDGRWQGILDFQGRHAMTLRRPTPEEAQPAIRKRPQEEAIAAGPLPYAERDVQFDNPAAGIRLAGTLSLPAGAGPVPAIVLVSGTGPNGRDEDIGTHKWMRVLADALCRRGIAVLRYDKRGVGGSTGRYNGATTADFASDARAAFDYLRTVAGIDGRRVGLLGHSEGGVIAPMVAAQSSDVAYVVLVASPGLRGDRLFVAQSATVSTLYGVPREAIARRRAFDEALYAAILAAPTPAAARDDAARLVRQGVADGIVDAADGARLADTLTAPWQRYFLAHDPATVLRTLKQPVLVISGALDAQVPHENVAVLKTSLAGNERARVVEVTGANHLLQKAATGAPSEYEGIEETIAPEALAIIVDWVALQAKH